MKNSEFQTATFRVLAIVFRTTFDASLPEHHADISRTREEEGGECAKTVRVLQLLLGVFL